MRIELYHASKFGNGARVAEELQRVMEAKGSRVCCADRALAGL